MVYYLISGTWSRTRGCPVFENITCCLFNWSQLTSLTLWHLLDLTARLVLYLDYHRSKGSRSLRISCVFSGKNILDLLVSDWRACLRQNVPILFFIYIWKPISAMYAKKIKMEMRWSQNYDRNPNSEINWNYDTKSNLKLRQKNKYEIKRSKL